MAKNSQKVLKNGQKVLIFSMFIKLKTKQKQSVSCFEYYIIPEFCFLKNSILFKLLILIVNISTIYIWYKNTNEYTFCTKI